MIARHDIENVFDATSEKELDTLTKSDFLNTGLMSTNCFKALVRFNRDETEHLSEEEIKYFLLELQLAKEIEEPARLFVPSLISSENEQFIREQFKKEYIESEHYLEFHYSIQKFNQTSQLFSCLLTKLASTRFFYKMENPGIHFFYIAEWLVLNI